MIIELAFVKGKKKEIRDSVVEFETGFIKITNTRNNSSITYPSGSIQYIKQMEEPRF